MALRFTPEEQAIYEASKAISEAETQRIRSGVTIDAVMRNTDDAIRATFGNRPMRQTLAAAIGELEGSISGWATPDALIESNIARFKAIMETLPEPLPVVEAPTPPPTPVNPVQNPERSTLPETAKWAISTPSHNADAHRDAMGKGVRAFFIERRLKRFRKEPSESTPA